MKVDNRGDRLKRARPSLDGPLQRRVRGLTDQGVVNLATVNFSELFNYLAPDYPFSVLALNLVAHAGESTLVLFDQLLLDAALSDQRCIYVELTILGLVCP